MSEIDYHMDRYYALLHALRDLPELPNPMVLNSLGTIGRFREDYDEGKRIQRERGLEAVPPRAECEIGAGFWHRVIRPVPTAGAVTRPKQGD
jgi:hypothetical protein